MILLAEPGFDDDKICEGWLELFLPRKKSNGRLFVSVPPKLAISDLMRATNGRSSHKI
ncbi:MAG: hypothetical protein GY927_11975 [bacterium]|nr:hypothetical protein [bacterium]